MFSMPELVTQFVIEDGLNHLASNPDHCRFILGAFCPPPLSKMVNHKHINQCVEFITNNKINVGSYYEMDIKSRPSVAIVSSGVEEQQYLGDYGQEGFGTVMTPVCYAEFDAKSIDGSDLEVPLGLDLETKLWRNQILTNGTFSATITGMVIKENSIILFLSDEIPKGTSLKGWKSISMPRAKGLEILSSMDNVTVQINLQSTGQASVHRLLVVVIRYCLKRGRQYFDAYGLQVPTFSYTPLMSSDADDLEYQTVFTVTCKASDTWIHREYDLNDSTKKIDIGLTVWPVDDVKNDPVELEF